MPQLGIYPRLVALGVQVGDGDYPLRELMTDDSGARPSRPSCFFAMGVTPEEQVYLTDVLTPYMAFNEMSWHIEREAGGLRAGKPTWYACGYWAATAVELSQMVIFYYYQYQ